MRHKLILIGIVGLILASITVLADPIGPNIEETCTEDTCNRIIYSFNKFDNTSGQYIDFAQVTTASWDNEKLTFTHTSGNYWVTIKPWIGYNGQEYSMGQVRTLAPNVNITAYKQSRDGHHKYGALFEGLTPTQSENIEYIKLHLEEAGGLTWDDVEREGASIIIKGKVQLSFSDLLESGYTLQLQDKKTLIIGNISANTINGSFDLDPVIQLNGSGTDNLADTYGPQAASSYNYGGVTYYRISAGGGYDNIGGMRWSFDNFPEGIIQDVSLSLYMYSNGLEAGKSYDSYIFHLFDYPTFSIDSQDWLEGNGSYHVALTGEWSYDNAPGAGEYNSTPMDEPLTFDSSSAIDTWYTWDVTPAVEAQMATGKSNFSIMMNANNSAGGAAGSDFVAFYTREYTTDTSLRPYLNITYTTDENRTAYYDINPNNGNYPLNVTVRYKAYLNNIENTTDAETVNITINTSSCTLQGSAIYTGGYWEQNCSIPNLTSGNTYDLEVCSNVTGSVTCDGDTDQFTYNDIIYTEIIDPTTASPDTVTAGDNVTIQYIISENGINQTTGILPYIEIGGLEAPAVSTGGGGSPHQDEYESFTGATTPTEITSDGWDTYYAVDSGCIWFEDSDGTGSSSTGPCSGSSNCATNDAGYDDNEYAYVETSSGNCNTGTGHAYMNHSGIDMDAYPDMVVQFAYNMYGSNMGNLSLQIDDGVGGWDTLWSLAGDQGTDWHLVNVSLNGYSGTREIRFDYDRNGETSFYGDVAVDVINLSQSHSTSYEFNYCSGGTCIINVTTNNTLSGTQSTFINVSHSGSYYTDTESNNYIFGAGPSYNCTCSGIGTNKVYDYSLACDITTDCNMTGGNITWTGSGTWTCHANIYVCNMAEPTQSVYIGGNCSIYQSNC